MNFFVRQTVTFRNDLARSAGALLGIAQGMLADGNLNDQEIIFLRDWLVNSPSIAAAWPGNVIHAKVQALLADGVITAAERDHLSGILQQMVGGTLAELAEATHVSDLALDYVNGVSFDGRRFCLTGEFVFGPRATCAAAIERRGGIVSDSITKKLNYVIVGGLGSTEWSHGSFGTKISKAFEYKQAGVPILVVHEDAWAAALCDPPDVVTSGKQIA
jgi:NAD-dependent DNA ligase